MPPQPFKGQWHSDNVVLRLRSKLAAHVGIIANLWTHVDLILASMLTAMLRADARSGMTMYLCLRGARPAAMMAVAEDVLEETLLKEFRQLMGRVRTVEGARNDVVHGIWGRSDDPENLIWLDPALHAAWVAAISTLQHKDNNATHSDWEVMNSSMTAMHSSALEYKEIDVIEIETRIDDLLVELGQFHWKISQIFPSPQMSKILESMRRQKNKNEPEGT
jgi:hypothetical protein